MSSTEGDTDAFESGSDEHLDEGVTLGPDSLFGEYSVLSPGVQIFIDGRAVSAPAD